MECIMGIKGKNFVVIATDCVFARSVVAMKKDQDKTFQLSKKLVMAISGEGGDTVQFAEYIAKNIQLYRIRNGYDLSVKAAASFTRRNLADSLRSQGSYHVNLLIGGHDDTDGADLFYMDYLGACVSIPFGVHGYGAYFSLSVLDRYYKPDMSEAEVVALLQLCINEIATRFIVNMASFKVKVIDANGVRELPDILAKAPECPFPQAADNAMQVS